MNVRCCWCGWQGDLDELDMDGSDSPAYCPECEHGSFDILGIDLRESSVSVERKDDGN